MHTQSYLNKQIDSTRLRKMLNLWAIFEVKIASVKNEESGF